MTVDTVARHATPDLDRVIDRMDRRLEELRRTGDRRERFLLMYRTFKGELRRNLQQGRFRDHAWSEAICCRMGEMYFEADDAYREDPESAPAPWALCFDSAVARRTNLLQDMLLGMNAHINYDLPLCTFQVMQRFGDTAELSERAETSLRFRRLLRRRYYDFLLINEIAWESIPLIQDVVCDRFNRLLKYANLLSFRFTRRITERIICEYRDRAWAHTLVLLTSPAERSVRDTRRHLSRFALRAAGSVERLTLNPLRHVMAPDHTVGDGEAIEAVARVLIDNLGYRPTRAIARQALLEYGDEAQPTIIRTLDQAPPLAPVRAELYGVLAATPTPEAVAVLGRSLEREKEKRGALLRVTADVVGRTGEPGPLRGPALVVARSELAAVRKLLGLTDAGFRDTILDEALRNRIHRGICRVGYALRTAGQRVPPPLTRCEFGPRRTPSLRRLAGWTKDMTVLARMAKAGDGNAQATVYGAAELITHGDPWIRTCAAWWIGATGRAERASPLVDRIRHDDHELVKETALAAAARVLPPDELRAAAAALLERPTYAKQTPARRLATEIERDGEATMITNIEKVLHLKNVTLFQDVLAEDLVTIARVAKEHRFKAGEQLIVQGEPGEAAYVVVDGEVRVSREGRELATVGAGAVLGEMSVVSDVPTSADCAAVTKGVALRIAREDFHALLQDYPTTAIGVMHVLADRLRETNVLATDGE
ncbi:MAG: DUF5995 family protein [Longimicrobiales bacterium]